MHTVLMLSKLPRVMSCYKVMVLLQYGQTYVRATICCKQHMLCKPSKMPRVISCFRVIVLLHDGQTDVHAQYVTRNTYYTSCSKMHIL